MTEYFTVTRDELAGAITGLGYFHVSADQILNEIFLNRKRQGCGHPERRFSEQEIRGTWQRLYRGGVTVNADNLITALRKDPFVAGKVYQDAEGVIWQRTADNLQWRKMGSTGLYSDNYPQRPMILMKADES